MVSDVFLWACLAKNALKCWFRFLDGVVSCVVIRRRRWRHIATTFRPWQGSATPETVRRLARRLRLAAEGRQRRQEQRHRVGLHDGVGDDQEPASKIWSAPKSAENPGFGPGRCLIFLINSRNEMLALAPVGSIWFSSDGCLYSYLLQTVTACL